MRGSQARFTDLQGQYMVLALERRGLLRRVAGEARSIRLLLPPGEIPKLARPERSGAC